MPGGEEKTKSYFQACHDYFAQEFGQENVVSAKVHLDETAPHMHLHFVPVNKQNGRLQARVAMNKAKINHIHDALPKFLQERGFDVQRGSGKTKDKNIENVHEYKVVQKKDSRKGKRAENVDRCGAECKRTDPFQKKKPPRKW
ncbi:plasmid recombination protein [Virgibacillus halophilus]|uniref:Plasmid recombination protein n=1 Tax=Tigheibacillus halophilus TaxID=361280 RepID=A0ABU5C1X4_9BACI|nr:plasmid recombination protein [Virgibacillus halophilus]